MRTIPLLALFTALCGAPLAPAAQQPPAPESAPAAPPKSKPAPREKKDEPGAKPRRRSKVEDPREEWRGPAHIEHSELVVPVPANFVFGAREAEHLLNRAGFGARPPEIDSLVRVGPEAALLALLRGPADPVEPFYAEPRSERDGARPPEGEMAMTEEQKKAELNKLRASDRMQMAEYTHWWVDQMLASRDALRERMALFWHGHFTSSYEDVKSSYQMIRQHQFLRDNALGSFADLVHGIARDPAMLEYLDNNSNRKGAPNENFARELMELFTLGVGNYSEDDIKEAARAFTGWSGRNAEFELRRPQHDDGKKAVLGKSVESGDDVIDVLLAQPACAEFIARKLLRSFEGVEPEPARVSEYGDFFRRQKYDLWALLNKLFVDPRFYREEVVGNRISGPVDYLVGCARRLGLRPPPLMIATGARALGQQLFFPPNVKGWDGGEAWINTATFMQRGNLAGMLLGEVKVSDMLAPELMAELEMTPVDPAAPAPGETKPEEAGAKPARKASSPRNDIMKALERFDRDGWRPAINLSARVERAGAQTDGEIVDCLASELLARALPADTREHLVQVLVDERAKPREPERGRGAARADADERVLRAVAHVLLSLPEAQLD